MIPALVPLERVLPEHLAASPVFSRLPPTPEAEVIAELEEDLRNPAYHYLVAEHEGRVVGLALAASLEISTGATGLNRPADAGYLAYAAVLPDARGLGAGRALGEAVLVWSRDAGLPLDCDRLALHQPGGRPRLARDGLPPDLPPPAPRHHLTGSAECASRSRCHQPAPMSRRSRRVSAPIGQHRTARRVC